MRVKFHFPGLCKELTAAGNVRWRVRVNGDKRRKLTIPVGPDHPDFNEHYEAARIGQQLKHKKVRKSAKGTLDELRERYVEWMEIQVRAENLKGQTFKGRQRGLQQACDCVTPNGKSRMGALNAALPMDAFSHIRDEFGEKTAAAEACIKALRAAYQWGAQRGFPSDSPVFRIKSTHVQKGGAVAWSQKDKKKFLDTHGPGTMARRWFHLADDTAGRIGDMHLLGPRHTLFRDDQQVISWQPGKRGSRPVEVPMSAELMVELAKLPDDAESYLLNEWGKPFASSGALGNRVRSWIIDAGLFRLEKNKDGVNVKKASRSQHGIRKARAEEIAEQGGSVYEVMSVLSHSDEKTAAIYTKKFERWQLAKQASERRKKAD